MRTPHPELATLYRWLPRGIGRAWLLPFLRLAFRVGGRLSGTRNEVLLGDCSVFTYRPTSADTTQPRPALLWMHGGGLIMGDARQDAVFLQRVADELGVVVASVQYRLAPEHPFPAPLDDCEHAYRWLAQQPDVDPTRIAVGGNSAGGGLAAALSQRLRTLDAPPVFQLLLYPKLDDRSAEVAHPLDDAFRMWDRASNHLGWTSYLSTSDVPPPAFAVPARTNDLSGLPPAWIGVGTLDLFHDEDVAYAERLRAEGIEVELEIVPGAYHAFDAVDAKAQVSVDFQASQLAALARHLAPTSSRVL